MFNIGDKVRLSDYGRNQLSDTTERLMAVSCADWLKHLSDDHVITVTAIQQRISEVDANWFREKYHPRCNINSKGGNYSVDWYFAADYLELVEPAAPYTTNTLGDFPKKEVI